MLKMLEVKMIKQMPVSVEEDIDSTSSLEDLYK